MSRAYYNEFDPNAAAWLRNLIALGHIAPGDVDERSIEDVTPADLLGYTQCHFFAGIGIWSYALRRAGWPDSRPAWSGSCPCQPFSTAGQGEGFADERHLWPAFFHLIQHGKGASVPVFGEQVASDDGLTWLELVQADMEGAGYAFRAVDLCSAGFGSPNIRQRFFFHAEPAGNPMGITSGPRLEGYRGYGDNGDQPGRIGAEQLGPVATAGDADGLGHPDSDGARGITGSVRGAEAGEGGRGRDHDADAPGGVDGVADPGHVEHRGRDTVRGADGEHDGAQSPGEGAGSAGERPEHDAAVRGTGDGVAEPNGERFEQAAIGGLHDTTYHAQPRGGNDGPGPVNGFWRASDWLWGKDGKWRPVEPGTFPLVARIADELGRSKSTLGGMARSNRVIRLKGYGNGINGEVATGFIRAVMQGQQ